MTSPHRFANLEEKKRIAKKIAGFKGWEAKGSKWTELLSDLLSNSPSIY
jgi:hypothetical protein